MTAQKSNSLLRSLAAIGPGIVVAGSVIGSGELINTPVQAAKFGFVLLWVVLLSCVIKYFLQVEIARHCLVHNRTTVEALNTCPGPKIRGTSWTALLYMLGYFATMLTIIGIIGALGGLMHGIWPLADSVHKSTKIWGAIMGILTIVVLWQGWYRNLEMLVMVLVGGFSISVFIGVFLIQGTPFRISADELISGLRLSLDVENYRGEVGYAVISLMGALGVAANELFMYPYWILEKGYARELGDPASAGWTERARQWIRTIWLDAGLSMLLATLVTGAFFLLGAAVLHRQQIVPEGLEVVDQISRVYTESYGGWSKWMFVIGAFCTLWSTLVVITAASGRMWADLFGSLGFLNTTNPHAVRRCHQITQTVWVCGLVAAFLLINEAPADLIIAGHFVLGAVMTPLLMFAICWMAFHTDRRVRMRRGTAVALIASVLVILVCVLVNLYERYEKLSQPAKETTPAAASADADDDQP
ncbi:MAG TPA: Nramp family divalent metal transporter [Lacipirellulaceae bacterium]|nr:Nramp family divalent metal transporter [Lacipirellulaceae bacterium]